jgi:transcription-repair coupling factor (superfamily II helicase)
MANPISTSFLSTSNRMRRERSLSGKNLQITGLSSLSALALLVKDALLDPSQNAGNHVIGFPDEESMQKFSQALHSVAPNAPLFLFSDYSVSPYSSLFPSTKQIAERVTWLFHAQNHAAGAVFLATFSSLRSRTLPFEMLKRSCHRLKVGHDLPASWQKLLSDLGYLSVSTVEDVGTFAIKGGILDIYSPAHVQPCRFSLFGDQIESARFFDPTTQTTTNDTEIFDIIPAREVVMSDTGRERALKAVHAVAKQNGTLHDPTLEVARSLSQGVYFPGLEFLLPGFYEKPSLPLEHFCAPFTFWAFDTVSARHDADLMDRSLKAEYESYKTSAPCFAPQDLFASYEQMLLSVGEHVNFVDRVAVEAPDNTELLPRIVSSTVALNDVSKRCSELVKNPDEHVSFLKRKFDDWIQHENQILCTTHSTAMAQRLQLLLEKMGYENELYDAEGFDWARVRATTSEKIPILSLHLTDSFRWSDENLVVLRDEDIFGRRAASRDIKKKEDTSLPAMSFGELSPGNLVVHKQHGIGIYEGLRVMDVGGVSSEFIEIRYKENDKLYLPVYRIGQLNKYQGPSDEHFLDKLGGTAWAKTTTKVRHQLRDVASQLLKLYALRKQIERPTYGAFDSDDDAFANSFPFEETDDQLKAIHDIESDLRGFTPMDRLVCGDVGFGKTEVAMRAAFKVVKSGKQVAIIAPTTILAFQHAESFKKRFAAWPFQVREFNRFVSNAEIKKSLALMKDGKVDIAIGTHRILSKDVEFKDLGLLIVDEEQKFGVVHKERLRHLRKNVDTLAMSATPIPRTLNMSLMGMRDLSLINTPPENRLPTRTFVCRFEEETIRKAITSEISRGGQVFFLHNRVQSIDDIASQIRNIVPTARIAIAHGQMPEDQLESVIMKFYAHEVDVLVCSAIIESGIDIPKANTIIINNAHTLGVSQLYQLRGRVGRSTERAYCYLVLPKDKKIDANALERVKIIQENTALGSGIRVAQYDLELRGAGDILGESQSGHINAVGYEMYLELLDEALHEMKGEVPKAQDVEPEINLKVSALIPDKYISDLRMRLYYYKSLSNIQDIQDIDRIENELRDQFGAPPEQVTNLFGVMLIRKLCKDLGVKDIGSGPSALALRFSDATKLPPQEIIRLTSQTNKKYSLAPDQRLKIRMNDISLVRVIDELEFLIRCIPSH